MKIDVVARGPFEFVCDEEGRLVIVSFDRASSDVLPALTEQAMVWRSGEPPSDAEGIRVLWDGHRFGAFATLTRFAGLFTSGYAVRMTNGRSVDRWLRFSVETPHARLFIEFLHKAVPLEPEGYAIDYALSAMSVVSRRHLARCGEE